MHARRPYESIARMALLLAAALPAAACDNEAALRDSEQKAEIRRLQQERNQLQSHKEDLFFQIERVRQEKEQALARAMESENDESRARNEHRQQLEKLQGEAAQLKHRIAMLEARPETEPEPEPDPDAAQDAVARSKTAREMLERLGAVLYQQRRYGAARDVLLVARHLGSEAPLTFHRLARSAAEMGEYEPAEANYERALEAIEKQDDPDTGLLKRCLLNYGTAMLRLDEPDEAVRLWERALELDGAFAAAHYNLGLFYAKQDGKREEAVAALRQHIIHGGSRSASARQLIEQLVQEAEGAPEPANEGAPE